MANCSDQVSKLETVLVVDDNEMVRTFVVRSLEGANFNVISAASGPNAIRLWEKTQGRIDLLLTDWDMPEMSGIELGQVLKALRPDMHVMLMSGGAHDTLLVLNYGWAFLQKPFVGERLVEMVTDVLHSPDRSQLRGEFFDTRLDTNLRSQQASDPEKRPLKSAMSLGPKM